MRPGKGYLYLGAQNAEVTRNWDVWCTDVNTRLKRPRNGNRSLRQIHEHIATDTLVGWAWAPGFGRSSAPGTQEQAGALLDTWIKTGAVCPD